MKNKNSSSFEYNETLYPPGEWEKEELNAENNFRIIKRNIDDDGIIDTKYFFNNILDRYDLDEDFNSDEKIKYLMSVGMAFCGYVKNYFESTTMQAQLDYIFWKTINSFETVTEIPNHLTGPISDLLNSRAYLSISQINFNSAIYFAEKALEISQSSSDYDTLGVAYRYLKNYPKSLTYFKMAVDLDLKNESLDEEHLENFIKSSKINRNDDYLNHGLKLLRSSFPNNDLINSLNPSDVNLLKLKEELTLLLKEHNWYFEFESMEKDFWNGSKGYIEILDKIYDLNCLGVDEKETTELYNSYALGN